MWVTAPPNPTYGSSISRWYSMNLKSWISLPQMQLFYILWQSVRTSAPAIIQLYGVLHPLSRSSFLSRVAPFFFLFDFSDVTFSSARIVFAEELCLLRWFFCQLSQHFTLYIQINRTPVAYHVGLCCCSVVLQVHSLAKSHLFCFHMWPASLLCLTGFVLMQSKQNHDFQDANFWLSVT